MQCARKYTDGRNNNGGMENNRLKVCLALSICCRSLIVSIGSCPRRPCNRTKRICVSRVEARVQTRPDPRTVRPDSRPPAGCIAYPLRLRILWITFPIPSVFRSPSSQSVAVVGVVGWCEPIWGVLMLINSPQCKSVLRFGDLISTVISARSHDV